LRLTRINIRNWTPRLSPDGGSMVLISGTAPPDDGKPSVGDYLLRELPIDGGEPRELARFYGGPRTGPSALVNGWQTGGIREPRAGVARRIRVGILRGWCRISVMRQLLGQHHVELIPVGAPRDSPQAQAQFGATRRDFRPSSGGTLRIPDFATLEKYCEPGEASI
jgi:hypothetical protein